MGIYSGISVLSEYYKSCVFILLIFTLPTLVLAEEPPVPPSSITQVATTPDETDRLRVEVTINGSAPLHFLVDTASTRTVIATNIAEALHLAAGKPVKVSNIGGIDRAASVIIPELHFSGITIHDIHAPSLLQANLGGEGLLGLDTLKGQRMTIDFRNSINITITPSSKNPEPHELPDEPGTIVVQAKSRMGELILTNAEIEGQHVSVIIDTGSEDSIGNSALRSLVNHRIAHTIIKPVTLLSVTGRQVAADFTQIGHVRIGGVDIANLPIAFADVSTFKQFGLTRRPAILLGMETLRLFARVTLDFPRREVRFLFIH